MRTHLVYLGTTHMLLCWFDSLHKWWERENQQNKGTRNSYCWFAELKSFVVKQLWSNSENSGLGVQISGFEPQPWCSLDLWPWASYLLSWASVFSFVKCPPISKVCDETLPQKNLAHRDCSKKSSWIWELIVPSFQVAWLLLCFIIFESFGLTI